MLLWSPPVPALNRFLEVRQFAHAAWTNGEGFSTANVADFPIALADYQTNWFGATGAVVLLVLLCAAYTLRVRQLRRKFKQLQDVLNTIPGHVWSAQPDGSVDFINQRLIEFLGIPVDRLMGSGWADAFHPDDREHYIEAWRAAVATGQAMEAEARVRRADGQYRWMLIRYLRLHDHSGKIIKWYGTSTDIDDRKHAEITLRESETRFRTLVDHVGDAIFVYDFEQGTIFDVNAQACEGLGYTPEELIGTTPLAFHLDSDRAAMQSVAERAAAGETVFDTHWHRRKDGTVFPVEVHTSLFRYGGRRFLLKVARDISDRVRAEEAVRKSEKQLRDVIDTIPVFVWSASPDGSVDFVNRQILEFSGTSFEEVLGGGWHAILHPDDREHHLEVQQASVVAGKEFDVESRLRRADGEYRWLWFHTVPLWDETGTVVKRYGVATDIEDRKRAEEALRRSEAYLADAQRLTGTGAWASNSKTDPLYWSEEVFRLFGFDPQGGLPAREEALRRIHPDDVAKFQLAFDTAIQQQKDCEVEFRALLPDGTVRHVCAIGHPVLNGNGEVVEVVGTTLDITERKRAEEERERLRQFEAELAHINRVSMMGELAASIAHEVNQPLTGIVSNGSACLRWLSGDTPNVEEAREAVRDVVRDGKRAGEIIARIRALTKRTAPPREELDVNETIREVLAIIGDEAKRKNVIIRTHFADNLAPISGDRVQLQQVMLNLVMNGMEAMSGVGDRERQMAITTRNIDQDQIQVTVQDSGVGLDPNAMARIFEPFFTTKSGGMGMGLSICRSILQNHSGRLWATANEGPGTSFHFTLPKQREERAARASAD